MRYLAALAVAACALCGAERTVDPTFLHRRLQDVAPKTMDVSTDTCNYKPLFGAGDSVTGILRGVARFGEITVAPDGACKPVSYAGEEQAYVILEGKGSLRYGEAASEVKRNDFMYLAPGVLHAVTNTSGAPLRLIVMGFKVAPGGTSSPKLQIANIDEIKKQTVGGHPDSVVYQLMMGDTNSKRDRIAAGRRITSLFLMEFQPGGTNFPHHHDSEEEIYLLLDGEGQMVAGGGMDGVEGRFPATPGDAYFFRLNCTVGFYNSNSGPAHILAVRSLYPTLAHPVH